MSISGHPQRGRRRVSTAAAVERVSIDLLLREGYDNVSVDDLAAAAGIGRTTFFRYFGTKAAVVCWGFDRALDELDRQLEAAPEGADSLEAVRDAIAASVRAGVDDRGVWWERFVLLDTVPALRAEVAGRWSRWVGSVAAFVARRAAWPDSHPHALAIASAYQGVYIATLRNWPGRPGDPEQMLAHMLTDLRVVGEALHTLL